MPLGSVAPGRPAPPPGGLLHATHEVLIPRCGHIAVSGALVVGSLIGAPAQAAPCRVPRRRRRARRALGDRSAGSYVDAGGKVVVNVTDAATAAQVRAAGAAPEVVKRSARRARRGHRRAGRAPPRSRAPPGAVDPVTNQVVVTVDSTVTGAKLAAVKADRRASSAARSGSSRRRRAAARDLRRRRHLPGGGPLLARLQRPQRQHLLLPDRRPLHQHRARPGTPTPARPPTLGTRTGTSFPGNDYGIVRYTNTVDAAGNVCPSAAQDITGAGNASVGAVGLPPRLHHRHPQRHGSPR